MTDLTPLLTRLHRQAQQTQIEREQLQARCKRLEDLTSVNADAVVFTIGLLIGGLSSGVLFFSASTSIVFLIWVAFACTILLGIFITSYVAKQRLAQLTAQLRGKEQDYARLEALHHYATTDTATATNATQDVA